MPDLDNSTTETGTSATTMTSSPDSSTMTVTNSGEANNGQGAPAEEGFTHVDPKTLPPQLRGAYDNMLRDYKEKTTKLSETIKSEIAKATESYRQKAEYYDQFSTQEDFVKMWNDFVQKSQTQPNGDPNSNPELAKVKAEIESVQRKLQQAELGEMTTAFAEAVNEKGEKINGDFDKLNAMFIGEIANGERPEQFSILRACVELAPGKTPQEKLSNGYKAAKVFHDAIFEEGRKAGLGRLQTKMQNGTLPPTGSSGDIAAVTDKKPKNAHEALAMAKRGLMVSRE